MPVARRRTIAWLRAEQAAFAQALAARAGLEIVLAGAPSRGPSPAEALACDAATDLRAALASADVDVALLLDAGDFASAHRASDADALIDAAQRGVRVFSTQPLPASVAELVQCGWLDGSSGGPAALGVAHWLGHLRTARAWQSIAELLPDVAEPHALSITVRASPHHASLGACVCSALDLAQSLMPPPESIDAAFASPHRAGPLHQLPAEHLAGLEGSMACTLRYPGGRAASIFATNRSAAWDWSVDVVGALGHAHVGPRRTLLARAGTVVLDEHQAPAEGDLAIEELGDCVSQVIEQGASVPASRVDHRARVLAIAQAALLSVRTNQAESPRTFQQLLGLDDAP